jgi:hypothetical protein
MVIFIMHNICKWSQYGRLQNIGPDDVPQKTWKNAETTPFADGSTSLSGKGAASVIGKTCQSGTVCVLS